MNWRFLMRIPGLIAATLVFLVQTTSGGPATTQPIRRAPAGPQDSLVDQLLSKGGTAFAEATLGKALDSENANDDLRLQLGMVQFFRGTERLMQSLYRFGLRDYSAALPILHLPKGENPNPEPISYEDLRGIIKAWLDDLMKVDSTLSRIRSSGVKVPLHVGRIRLDLNGDGSFDEDETLWRVFDLYAGIGLNQKAGDAFLICFDRADIAWLRGYCHLLAALSEIALAHDFREQFERTGHVIFLKTKTPHKCVQNSKRLWPVPGGSGSPDISDVIAFIHLINYAVIDPPRMQSALRHLEMMVTLSRETWDLATKEVNDDHEWLPSPNNRQHSVLAGLTLSPLQLGRWRQFLDSLDALLAGRKLLPHWRFSSGEGINIRRVFTEPRPFDLVLWIQGTAATPYVEKGPVLDPEIWQQLDRAFQGGFINYAIWFN